MCETVYIGAGSNIDPERNIRAALELLGRTVQVLATSTCYRSAALDRPEQEDFINCVWRVVTPLPAETLKYGVLRDIEEQLGRIRTADRCAARTIDLDILLYGGHVIRTERLAIPDPDIVRRDFIAVPLLELEPGIVIPGTGKPLAEITAAVSPAGLTGLRGLTSELRAIIEGAAPR